MPIKLKSLLTEIAERQKHEFMAKFGVGPLYKPKKPKTYECPKCKKHNARKRTAHEDTEIECIELRCPDCGYSKELD